MWPALMARVRCPYAQRAGPLSERTGAQEVMDAGSLLSDMYNGTDLYLDAEGWSELSNDSDGEE